MGIVPHSGNLCSGLCADADWDGRNGICDHEDCWQCAAKPGAARYWTRRHAQQEAIRKRLEASLRMPTLRREQEAIRKEDIRQADAVKAALKAKGVTDEDMAAYERFYAAIHK